MTTWTFGTVAGTPAPPVLSVRIDWRNNGFNFVTNDGFEANVFGGWAVSSGGSSLARITTSAYVGLASAQVTTTTTLGTGATYTLAGTFTAGRTYRLSVAVQSVSGTTSARITLGSRVTTADRGNLLPTLTTDWAAYTVDWTPSADRTDAIVQVVNNATSVMVANIDAVEVFELIDDITNPAFRGYPDALTFGRGASFDGSTDSPGLATLNLNDPDGRYARDNTGSPLYGLARPGRRIWIRATYSGKVYPLYYGTIRRFIPQAASKTVEVQCEDPLRDFGKSEASVSLSDTRSLTDYRATILTNIGINSSHWDLATDSPELAVPFTGIDQTDALSALTAVNVANGSTHYIVPDASSSSLYQYRVVARTDLVSVPAVESYADDLADMGGYDITDEGLINTQRVRATPYTRADSATVWDGGAVTLGPSASVTLWPDYGLAVLNQSLVSTTTAGSATASLTPFRSSGKLVITAGVSGVTFSQLVVRGQAITPTQLQSALYADTAAVTADGPQLGSEVDSVLISSVAEADALARWIVTRYKDAKARPTATVINRFPSQLSRDITDRISLTFVRLFIAGREFLVRGFTTSVTNGGNTWTTVYQWEEAPAYVNTVRIGGTPDQGIGGTAVLAA